MSKKLIFFFIGILSFFSFNLAYANLIINEVMYDLSGADSVNSKSREWIEIHNSGTSDISIDASKWRIYDGSGNRTINGEVDFSISADSYVIFAGDKDTFLLDHPNFSGAVYDTGFTSLNNTGANLKLLDQDGNVADSVTYASSQGGAGDGNSLQKISGSWSGATSTPGEANEAMNSSPSSNNSNNTGSGSGTSVNTNSLADNKIKIIEEPKIKTKIISKTLAFVGSPLIFQANAFGYKGEKLYDGRYFWNFGDGDSKEIRVSEMNNFGKFTHIFLYPGEYNVNLEYYANYYGDIPDASDQIIIKVVGADLIISKVGDEKDFFIELTNNTSYDIDISKYILASSAKNFTFPKNTFINAKKKIIISGNITHFSVLDKDSLRLINPQGVVLFDYGASFSSPTSIKAVNKNVVQPEISTDKNQMNFIPALSNTELKSIDKPIVISNPQASAIKSDVIKNNFLIPYLPIFVFVVLIGGSASAVYFIRRKKIVSKTGDDFEILDA